MSVTQEQPIRFGTAAKNRNTKTVTSKKHFSKDRRQSEAGTPSTTALKGSEALECLGRRLRRWAQHHDWNRLEIITHRLQLYRAFGQSVCAAVVELIAAGHSKLAFQAKTDFGALLDLVHEYDMLCRRGCTEEDDLVVCEHIQERIFRAIDDLAALLDHRVKDTESGDSPVKRPADETIPSDHAHVQWMTFAQAADLLAVGKGTVSKWARQGRFVDNGLPHQKRRLSKASVLMVKQEIDDAELNEDVRELRRDARRIAN